MTAAAKTTEGNDMHTTIAVDNETDHNAEAPVHPVEGHDWQHALVHGAGTIVYADSLGELIAVIIPGYSDLPDTPDGDARALIARHEHLVDVANTVQAGFNADAIERGLFDPTSSDVNTLTGLGHDRARPWPGTDIEGVQSYQWPQTVPLALLSTDYAPYTTRPCPTGNVVLLDGSSELAYLRTLTSLGLIGYLRRP